MIPAADFMKVQNAILRKSNPKEAEIEASSGTSLSEYIERLLQQATTSTIPAIVLTDAIEGSVPVEDRLGELAEFAQAQFDHYANVLKVLDPKLGPYEALGRFLSGTAGFYRQSAGKSDREFIRSAWKRANPAHSKAGPSNAVIEHYIAQLDYFGNLYQRVGLSKSDAANWSRGAVYGQIFGAAALDHDANFNEAARRFLREAAAGTPRFGSPLEGRGQPAPGERHAS